jgi:putative transposase
MARLARITVPGLPHHVTQRGNGRQTVFFSNADYALYRNLLAAQCRTAQVDIWAWCLMPNHVHLLLVPKDEDGLRSALSKVHRLYAGIIHAREKRSGHFWQGRFGSVALDEDHLLNAFCYIADNPVRARLTSNAADWPWSSTRAYLSGKDDGVTERAPMLSRFPDMEGLLGEPRHYDLAAFEKLRRAETIGRPLGDSDFLDTLADRFGRTLAPGKPGPKRRGGKPNSGDSAPNCLNIADEFQRS